VWDSHSLNPEPIKYWVNWIPEETRAAQFVVSPPILQDSFLVEEWVNNSEALILEAHERLARPNFSLDLFDPKRNDWNCKGCSFKRPCFGEEEWETSEVGLKPRVDHHREGEVE
jgi:hypothetical protein